jgi:hypothetical protein
MSAIHVDNATGVRLLADLEIRPARGGHSDSESKQGQPVLLLCGGRYPVNPIKR